MDRQDEAQGDQWLNAPRKSPTWRCGGPILISILALSALIGGFGAWAMSARIAGAVIGHGAIAATAIRQAVQHETGGVVDRIFVQNGDLVAEGDVVVTLEAAALRSELDGVEIELLEMLMQEVRLDAEIAGASEIAISAYLEETFARHPSYALSLTRQQTQLHAARLGLAQKLSMLDQQIRQAQSRRAGLEAQHASKRLQLSAARRELDRMRHLRARGLVVQERVATAQKEATVLSSEVAVVQAELAETDARISELSLQRAAAPEEARILAIAELNRIQPLRANLTRRRDIALADLAAMVIRAPAAGAVHDLQLHGARAVARPGEPLMYIVPQGEPLLASVRIDARDIEEVHVGQQVMLRFPAFNQRATPLIPGAVTSRSADSFFDMTKTLYFYTVEIEIDYARVAEIEGMALVSGMPVEAFITTQERSPIAYILRPISVYFEKAFRDN